MFLSPVSIGVPVNPIKDALGNASLTYPANPSMRSYCERCASSAIIMMFLLSEILTDFVSLAGANF